MGIICQNNDIQSNYESGFLKNGRICLVKLFCNNASLIFVDTENLHIVTNSRSSLYRRYKNRRHANYR